MKLYLIKLNDRVDYFNGKITDGGKISILYADFNVINFLYDNKLKVPQNMILYPDSIAVNVILKIMDYKISRRIVSTDLQDEILMKANRFKLRVFFFGDKMTVLNNLQIKVEHKYPDLIIAGLHSGYNFNTESVINKVNASKPDILFVGLGVGRQEPWIIDNAEKLNVSLILSVGGWFNFLAGTKKRAPLIFRSFKLEWLFKVITDFKRLWKRYLFGVPKFFYRVLSGKIQFEFVEHNG